MPIKKKENGRHPLTLLSSSGRNEDDVALLWDECDRHLFSDAARVGKALAILRKQINDRDVAELVRWLHISALHDNNSYHSDEAEEKFVQARQLLDTIGIYQGETDLLIDYIGVLLNNDKLELASEYLASVHKDLHEKPDERLQARVTVREANLHVLSGYKVEAYDAFLNALSLYKNITPQGPKDYHFISLIYDGCGRILESNHRAEEALEMYQKAIGICEEHNINTRLPWYYYRAGNAYAMMDNQQEAIEFYKKSLKAGNANDSVRAIAFANWGRCLFDANLTKRALELYNKAEEIYLQNPEKNQDNIALINIWRSEIATKKGNLDDALHYLEKAAQNAERANNFDKLAHIYESIGGIHALKGKYQQAYLYQLKHAESFEASKEMETDKAIRSLRIKYDTESKKQAIEKLEYQAKALQLKALRAQMNPHFLFNALNSIQNFILNNNEDQAITYLAAFAKLIRRSLEYSNFETISLPKEIEFLKDYLYINKHLRFRNKIEYDVQVNDTLEDEDYEIPSMIIQPYVENAIEHGIRSLNSGMIVVKFDLFDEDTIRCVVTDDGVGYKNAIELKNTNPNHQLHKSMGTKITVERLSMLNSKHPVEELVKIEEYQPSNPERPGTKVTILIPLESD